MKVWLWRLLPALGVTAGLGAIYLVWLKPRPQAAAPAAAVAAVRTTKVTRGTFVRTVRVSGQTSARHFVNITVPVFRGPDSRRDLTLIKLAPAGAAVKKGDLILQFDAQVLQDHIDDMNDVVEQAQSDLKKRLAQQAVDWENLQQTLRQSRSAWEKARLDAKATEVRPEIQQELDRLAVEEAEAVYKQAELDASTLKKRHEAELRILAISREQQVIHRDRHVADLEKFTIRAPMDGLVVMQQIHRHGENAQVREGDQVNPGQPIMKIVDPHSMQVDAVVNQTDNTEFRLGQPARVGFDAFPDLVLRGKVYSVGALAVRPGFRENYYIRTVPLRIAIEGSDPRVIPDLSAWADVELERQENVLLVPLEAVRMESGKPFVYVRQGQRFERRPVELGSRSHTHAVVLAGLQPGEEIALEEPPARKP